MKTKQFFLCGIFIISTVMVSAQFIILSGPEQGSYYQFAEDMTGILNTAEEKTFVNQSTSGAAYNFSQLIEPNSPFKVALVQSDYLYYMKGFDLQNNTEKTKYIKVLLPLAPEEIHLVTRQSEGITSLNDLDSAIVGIGSKGQGTYATATIIKDRSKIYWSSRNFHFDNAIRDMYQDKTDAFFIVGSAPIAKLDVNPQTLTDELVLVSLENVNDWAKYYEPMTISKDTYKWLDRDVATYGVRMLLVVNESKLTEEDKAMVVKLKNGIKQKLGKLQQNGHPKWKEVNLDDWDKADWPLYK